MLNKSAPAGSDPMRPQELLLQAAGLLVISVLAYVALARPYAPIDKGALRVSGTHLGRIRFP